MRYLVAFMMVFCVVGCEPESRGHGAHGDAHEEENHGHAEHGDAHEDEHGSPGAGDGEEEGVVHLSPEALKRSGIRVDRSVRGGLEDALDIPAEVELDPDRVAHVNALVGGQIRSVEVTLGDMVEEGATLVTLRSVDLGTARAELERASASQRAARQNLERQRELREQGISAAKSLVEAERAHDEAVAQVNAARSGLLALGQRGGRGPDMKLVSPIQGRVLERHATRGENVTSQDTLFVVADLSRVWVMGQVYEQQISRVKQGMPVTLTFASYPGRTWQGKIDFVEMHLNESTHTLPVRVEMDNPEGLLRPGLFGSLRLLPDAADEARVLVPRDAVQNVEGKRVVFVPGDEPGEFRALPITTGAVTSDLVEVIEGLTSGQELVVEGAFILKSELARAELGHGHAH